ncbi:MAG: type II secretion system F family protein [Paracoccaceae bacterium]
MGAYQFRAVDGAGKTQSGVMEAASAAAARQGLRAKGWFPVDVTERAGSVAAGGRKRASPRLPLSALTLVTRQMATLLGSGLRIEEALTTIASGQPPRVAAILLNVRAAVMEGRSFADALAAFPLAFSEYYRASVRAGEQAGKLDQVMGHLAAHVEHRSRNRQSVQLALLYPALLGLVSLAIIMLLMTYVVPDIVKVFRDRGADLPLLTRALIAISDFVRGYGIYALSGLLLAALGVERWLKAPRNLERWHGLLARGRLTARLVQRLNAAQCAGTLATLLQSQVPLVEAMSAATDVIANLHIRAKMRAATDKVRQGTSLQRAMTEAQVFPPMMIAMVASGEASGHLGRALDHAATEQQRDLDAWVKAVVALVEPAILVVMGGLVMAMVLAILLPIVSLNGLANG